MKSLTLVFVLLGISFCCGCLPPTVRTVARPQYATPEASTATVWFVRKSLPLGETGQVATVWDGENLVGITNSYQAFKVDLEAGYHKLVVISPDSRDVVEANLVGGKNYYVYLWYRDFYFGQTVMVYPFYEGEKNYSNMSAWFDGAKWVEMDPVGVPEWRNMHINRVKSGLADFDPRSENAIRAIRPEYGK